MNIPKSAYKSSAHVKQKQRRIRVYLVHCDSKETKILGVITGDILQAAKLQLHISRPIIRLTEYTAVHHQRQCISQTTWAYCLPV
eukprot:scaffold1384_cov116-Cylindrotheca_fusiformis.AAC.1